MISLLSSLLYLGFTVVKRDMLDGEWIDKVVNLPSVKAEYIVLAIPNTQTNLELIKYHIPEENVDPCISMPKPDRFSAYSFRGKRYRKRCAKFEKERNNVL